MFGPQEQAVEEVDRDVAAGVAAYRHAADGRGSGGSFVGRVVMRSLLRPP